MVPFINFWIEMHSTQPPSQLYYLSSLFGQLSGVMDTVVQQLDQLEGLIDTLIDTLSLIDTLITERLTHLLYAILKICPMSGLNRRGQCLVSCS